MRDRSKQIHMESQVKEKSEHHDVRRIPDRTFLNLFTVLAEGNEKERIDTTATLIQRIKEKQAGVNEGLCEEAVYTVDRLVKGLASSRMFARLGYSIALCQLLRTVDAITTQTVLDAIEKHLSTSKDAPGSDQGGLSLGQVFGHLALIQSKKLFDGEDKHVKKCQKTVVEALLQLSTGKSYLQQLCMNGVVQVIAQMKKKTYKKNIFPLLESHFTAGWGNCTPDTLLLVLYSHRHHKETVSEMLKDHWLGEELITEKNFPLITDVVMRATHCFPIIHSVIDELVQEVLAKDLNMNTFWKQVVHPLFTSKGTAVPKRAVSIHIFNLILDKPVTPETMDSMLQSDVVGVLVQYDPTKKGDLADRAAALLKRLVNVVQASQDAQMQLTILRCLIQNPGSPQFDSTTKTSTLSEIIAKLLPEAAEEFAQQLMNAYKQEPSWISPAWTIKQVTKNWCIKELVTLIIQYKLSPDWQLKILQLLLIDGFFSVKKSSSDIPHCTVHKEEVPAQQQRSCRDNFYKATSKLAIIRSRGKSVEKMLGNTLDVLYSLVIYCQQLLSSHNFVQLEIEKFSTDAQEEWNKVLDVVKAVDKKRRGEEGVTASHAFEIMFIHEAFQLLHDPEGTTELLQDLYVCYKKSNQRRKSKIANDEEPPWMDVITDVLLNMMFKDRVASRNVAKVVMNLLAAHVTPTSLQLIVDALQQKGVDSEDGILGLEDGDEEQGMEVVDADTLDEDGPCCGGDDADNDDDDDDDDDDDESSEESEESEASDLEEKDFTPLKKKVKATLGDAAGHSDEEEESEEEADMTDKQMEKLNDVLAAAFRSMKMKNNRRKDKLEKENQLKIFKIRVLDLVEVLARQSTTVLLMKTCLVPLLELMKLGNVKQEDRALGTRASHIYQALCKGRKVTADGDCDREDLLVLLGQLLKAGTPECVQEVVKGCAMVIRTLLNIQDNGPSPLKTRAQAASTDNTTKSRKDHDYYQMKVVETVRGRMMDMFSKNSSPYPPLLFQLLLQRFQALDTTEAERKWVVDHLGYTVNVQQVTSRTSKLKVVFWGLYPDLIATIGDADVKAFHKTQAAQYLSTMINRGLVKDVGQETWTRFLKGYELTLSEVLDGIHGPKIKRGFVMELLTVILKISSASPDLITQVLTDPVVTKLEAVSELIQDQPLWNCYTNVMKALHSDGVGKRRNKKKKRKNAENVDNNSNSSSSPSKMSKLSSPTDQNVSDHTGSNGTVSEDSGISTPGKNKKNKTNNKKNKGDANTTLNGGSLNKSEADSADSGAPEEIVTTQNVGTPKSEKKKNKKKRKSQGDLNGDTESTIKSPGLDISQKKAKLSGKPIINTNSPFLTVENGVKSPDASRDSKAKGDIIQSPKATKFSPRYTRSKQKQKKPQN